MTNPDDQIQLCCLLWAHPGQAAGLTAYEDKVLAYVPEHAGTVVQRATADGADGHPNEVQLYAFATQADLDDYLADPRRAALKGERDRVVARTELFPVDLL